MMAGNPRGFSIHPSSSLFTSQFVFGSSVSSSSSLPFDPLPQENQEHHHQSWSQLLMGGLPEEEDRYKLGNWEDQHMINTNIPPFSGSCSSTVIGDRKPEVSGHNLYGFGDHEEQLHTTQKWSLQQHQMIPVSSPRSCVTTLSSNMLDFSYTNPEGPSHHMDQSSECNSSATGRACKKARVQATTSQPPLKVRKEKLGDRITALHQLVSPFGKTDTASVLLEAIGYIRFLQGQIEALSSPYLASANSNIRNQHSAERERNNVFPEDPGQLLNDICLKRNGGPNLQDSQDNRAKDLKSRGLCLVPLSCTLHVGNDNGADYWAPAMSGGFYN